MLAAGSAAFEYCRFDVDKFIAYITPEVFRELFAWSAVTGWGQEWLQAGTIAAAIYNTQRTGDSEPISPEMFVPYPPIVPQRNERSEEDKARQLAAVQATAAARYGGGRPAQLRART